MNDEHKPKEQLIRELLELRQRVAALDTLETQRKRAGEARRESEERYRELVENANDILYTHDPEGNFTSVNPAATRIYGYSAEEALKLNITQILDPKYLPLARQKIREKLEGSPQTEPYELLTYSKEGEPIWVEVSTRLVKREGRPVEILGIARDITERKLAEEALRRYAEQVEALREVGLELTAQLDLDTLLHSIVVRAAELCGEAAGSFCFYRPEKDVLEWAIQIGPQPVPAGTILRRGEGVSGKVLETGESLIVNDYQHWEGRAEIFKDYPCVAIVGVPVRWGDEFLGVLNILADAPRTFSPADAELLSLLATEAAIAIKNAQLFSEREQRAKEFETLYKASLDLISLVDLSKLVEAIVGRAAELLEAKSGGLYIYDPMANELELVASYKLDKDYRGTRLRLGEGFCGKVAQSSKPLLVDNYSHWEVRSDRFARDEVARLGVPLKRGSELLGVLFLDGKGVNTFGERDVRLASLFAAQAAIAIENARLYEKVRQRADQLTGLFMSHELRGPLTNIKMAAQTWDSLVSGDDALRGELINILERESDRLTWYVERISNIVALEAGLAKPEWQEVSLRSLVAKAVDPNWLPQHDHRLEVLIEGELKVRADEGWTVMVIRNLLENAIKHCPSRSHIKVLASKVDEHWAKVTVADNGKGIDAQDVERIFEKFYRGKGASDGAVSGQGIGLYLVRLLVEAQGGTVWVNSEEGKGANFGFSLPLAR